MSPNPITGLLRSRAFLLALLGVIQTVVSHYASIPDDVWQAINALIIVVIGKIAVEDTAAKLRGTHAAQK